MSIEIFVNDPFHPLKTLKLSCLVYFVILENLYLFTVYFSTELVLLHLFAFELFSETLVLKRIVCNVKFCIEASARD